MSQLGLGQIRWVTKCPNPFEIQNRLACRYDFVTFTSRVSHRLFLEVFFRSFLITIIMWQSDNYPYLFKPNKVRYFILFCLLQSWKSKQYILLMLFYYRNTRQDDQVVCACLASVCAARVYSRWYVQNRSDVECYNHSFGYLRKKNW